MIATALASESWSFDRRMENNMSDPQAQAPGSPAGFVQRELSRIEVALRETPSPECYERLYMAQQALSWVLEPTGFASPLDVVMGIPATPADCSGEGRPRLS